MFRKRFSIVKILLVLGIIIYVIKLVINTFDPFRTIAVVQYGSIQNVYKAQGVIIRNECIIKSPITGVLELNVKEGEKVGLGFELAVVYDENNYISYKNKLDEIDKKITENEENIKNSPFQEDLKKIEEQITEKEDALRNAKDKKYTETLKKEIESLKNKQNLILGEKSTYYNNLQLLYKQKEEIVSQFKTYAKIITSPMSGIVTFNIDGYEELLNPLKMESINEEFINKVENKDLKPLGSGQKVESDTPVLKVVDNFNWFVAFVINDVNKDFKINEVVKIKLENSSEEIDGRVFSIKDINSTKRIIIIKLDKYIKDFYSIRKANLEIIKDYYVGLKVPKTAVIQKDGQYGVYLYKSGGKEVFKPVIVKGMDDKFAIIENVDKLQGLKIYDEILKHPKVK